MKRLPFALLLVLLTPVNVAQVISDTVPPQSVTPATTSNTLEQNEFESLLSPKHTEKALDRELRSRIKCLSPTKAQPFLTGICVIPSKTELNQVKQSVYIFHVLHWGEDATSLISSRWYTYEYDESLHSLKRISQDGIYQDNQAVLISIQYGFEHVAETPTPFAKTEYNVNIIKKSPANVTALTALLSVVFGISNQAKLQNTESKNKPRLSFFAYRSSAKIDPNQTHLPFAWSFTMTTSFPTKGAIAAQSKAKQEIEKFCKNHPDDGSCPSSNSTVDTNAIQMDAEQISPEQSFVAAPPPNTQTNTGAAQGCKSGSGASGDVSVEKGQVTCTFTQSFTSNEAEFWNIGINILPHGPRENIYSQSTTNTITQKHTFHSPLVAVVDINPFARLWSMNKGLYFQAGVPLTGAAFHLPYVGTAFPLTGVAPPLKKIFPVSFSIYAGVMFMEQTFPRTLQTGQTATTAAFNSDLRTDRALKPVFGIEVPLGAIVGKIKGATFK